MEVESLGASTSYVPVTQTPPQPAQQSSQGGVAPIDFSENNSKGIDHKKTATVQEIFHHGEGNDKMSAAEKEKAGVVLPSEAAIKKATDDVNKVLQYSNRRLDLSYHEKTNRVVVKVVDTVKDEVIREIPSKQTLDFLASILEQTGILVDKKS